MLGNKDLFQGSGRVNKDALAGFIKDIKKNTKLSDEDAAVIAASKVTFLTIFYIFWTKIFLKKYFTLWPQTHLIKYD